jgi:aminomethyltransferase
VNAANRDGDHAWIVEHIGDRATVVDASDSWSQLAVQGPEAVTLVTGLVPETAALAPFAISTFEFAGATGYVSRTGYTGEDGFELYVPNEVTVALFDALMVAGAGVDIKPVGLGARDTLRLEARLMLYGNDISLDTNPVEAGLSWIVKPTDPPFIGQAAIESIQAGKPSRRLRGLLLEGKGVLRAGYPVFVGDLQVGATTSGGIAPSLDDRSIGLAYIDIEHAGIDSVEVEIRGRRIPASVTRSPFYKRATA